MLTEMVEYGHKIEGKSEGYEKWSRESLIDEESEAQCTGNWQWRAGNWESNEQFGAEGRNKHSEQNEETRIQKNEERLRNLQDSFKCSNIRIIGVPEGEE